MLWNPNGHFCNVNQPSSNGGHTLDLDASGTRWASVGAGAFLKGRPKTDVL